MEIKATWKSKNPFIPDVTELGYTKTVKVPDDTDIKVLEDFAKEDTLDGYVFEKIEIINAT